jgi:hypothetical protein
VKAVRVFAWIHLDEGEPEIEMRRQWVLDDETVHGRLVVQAANRRVQLGLRGFGPEVDILRSHTDFRAGLVLLANVSGTRRIVAHQDGGEPGHDARRTQRCHATSNVTEHTLRDRPSFE